MTQKLEDLELTMYMDTKEWIAFNREGRSYLSVGHRHDAGKHSWKGRHYYTNSNPKACYLCGEHYPSKISTIRKLLGLG